MRLIISLLFLSANLNISLQAQQIVLNEIMFNPDGEENDNEYIELVNRSALPINLENWRVTDGADTDRIAALEQGTFTEPGQYVLVLDPDYFENGSTIYDGRIPSDALVVTIDNVTFGDRGLSNSSAEHVTLITPQGQAVAAYTYSLGNQQGYSEEKVLPLGGDETGNWTDSRTYGGTPGGRNSVTPFERDLAITAMTFSPASPEQGEQVTIDIQVKNLGLSAAQDSLLLYRKDLSGGGTDSLQLKSWNTGLLQPGDSLRYTHEWMIPNDSLFALIGKLKAGDENPTNDEWIWVVNPGSMAGWMVINEIMYQPETQRTEWVEIHNASMATWNGTGWAFGDGAGIMDSNRRLYFPDLILSPSHYLVVASDSSIFFENVPVVSPIIVWNALPISLNNSGDSLVLFDNHGQPVDRVDYRPSWGDGQLGVSIERISAVSASNDPMNWATSLDSTGATPGRINSRVLPEFRTVSELLVLEPNPFSPDGDGHDDILAVRYSLDHADSRLDLKIFDVRGREVRRLANNESAGFIGEKLWDGKDNGGNDLPTGLYIVYLEAFGSGSTRLQSAKRTVALARRS